MNSTELRIIIAFLTGTAIANVGPTKKCKAIKPSFPIRNYHNGAPSIPGSYDLVPKRDAPESTRVFSPPAPPSPEDKVIEEVFVKASTENTETSSCTEGSCSGEDIDPQQNIPVSALENPERSAIAPPSPPPTVPVHQSNLIESQQVSPNFEQSYGKKITGFPSLPPKQPEPVVKPAPIHQQPAPVVKPAPVHQQPVPVVKPDLMRQSNPGITDTNVKRTKEVTPEFEASYGKSRTNSPSLPSTGPVQQPEPVDTQPNPNEVDPENENLPIFNQSYGNYNSRTASPPNTVEHPEPASQPKEICAEDDKEVPCPGSNSKPGYTPSEIQGQDITPEENHNNNFCPGTNFEGPCQTQFIPYYGPNISPSYTPTEPENIKVQSNPQTKSGKTKVHNPIKPESVQEHPKDSEGDELRPSADKQIEFCVETQSPGPCLPQFTPSYGNGQIKVDNPQLPKEIPEPINVQPPTFPQTYGQ